MATPDAEEAPHRRYNKACQRFTLTIERGKTEAEEAAICDRKLAEWNRATAIKRPSRFYRIVEWAGGRCEACGVLGTDGALEIDHVVPQSKASLRSEIPLPSGEWVSFQGDRNLQALGYICNRGRRDASGTDFRPTVERLAKIIALAEERAHRLGYDSPELDEAVHGQRPVQRSAP